MKHFRAIEVLQDIYAILMTFRSIRVQVQYAIHHSLECTFLLGSEDRSGV